MFLVVHSAAGIVLATAVTRNPAAALVVGWLSHHILDFLPHGDEAAGVWTDRGHRVKRYALLAAVDFALVAALFLLVASRHGWSWLSAFALAGAVLPDVAWGLEMAFDRRLFGPYGQWHDGIHSFLRRRLNVSLPLWLGLALQTALAVPLWSSLYAGC